MDYNEVYWIFIAEALGYGSHRIKDIFDNYKSAKSFYDLKSSKWENCNFLSKKNLESLTKTDINKVYKIIDKCKKLGYTVITLENPQYPLKLKNISNPPAVLYVKGELPMIDNRLCISIVGTRDSTPYGNKISFEMGYKLAKAGAIVVSGAALGIDCISQKGALQAFGKTIAVLGCGINFKYLMVNKNLRDNISKNGALVSEYPPDYHTAPWTFPMRNRIISGLCDGTLIVEAGEKSGSLITANLALEQNRDLFAVPGNINSSVSEGTNKLIKICAKPVMCAEDILEEYYHLYPYLKEGLEINKENKDILSDLNEVKTKVPNNLSNRAKLVFENLKDKPIYADELSELSKLSVPEVLQAITELELYGLIKIHAGKRYSK